MWLIAESGQLQADGTYWESELTTPNNDSIGNSIGFVLATKGFDVWLANYRGNIYSMNHTTLNVEDSKFWEFSIDEMTREDLPALIEYVKEQTQKPSIGYIGHSQGNIMMFGLLAIQPKYSDSIRPFIALSPVFYGGRIRGPARFLHPFTQLLLK